MIYKNLQITTKDEQFFGWIEIDNKSGNIDSINHGEYLGEGVNIDCQNLFLLPGFIDSHTHGGYGLSFNDLLKKDSVKDLKHYQNKVVSEGVIGVVATTVTDSINNLQHLLPKFQELLFQPTFQTLKYLAWHIEGPFISIEKKGAHNENLIIPLNEFFLTTLKNYFPKNKLILTVAPENNNLDLIKKYSKDFSFSLGHTNDFQYSNELIANNDVNRITHLFNAMSGYFHNKKGLVNTIFEIPKLANNFAIEVITDGHHIRDDVLLHIYKNLSKDNLVIISDSLPAKGLKNGSYTLGSLKILKEDNVFYLADHSSLAGSGMAYNLVLAHFHKVTNCSWNEIVLFSSYNTAKNLNIENNFGIITKNILANLVILDNDFNIFYTIIDGKVVYQK